MLTSEEIIKALPLLADEALERIQASIRFLLDTERGKLAGDQVFGEVEEIVHDCIRRILEARGISVPPLAEVKRGKEFPKLKHESAMLDQFVRVWVRPSNETERRKSLRLCIEHEVEFIIREMPRVPVCFKVVVQQLEKIPSILDSAFPGYKDAGLLNLPFTMKKQTKNKRRQ